MLPAVQAVAGPAGHGVVGEFEPIVVTAARTAETADEALASVTVINRQDIERLQVQSVQDLLRGVPGIDMVNQGGEGKLTSMFLRGTESDHLLVLVDGVKIAGVTTGMAPFQHIPVEQVERIEIVRGPRSSLYGAEAIGGVIQIFTRKGGGGLRPTFSIGAGSYQSYTASAGISGGGENGWFSASLSGRDSAGFNACDGKPFPDGAGCFTVEPDDDGFRNRSGSLRGGYRFANGLQMDAHLLRSESDSDYDGGFSNREKALLQVIGATLRYSPTASWQLSLSGGNSLEKSENFKDSSSVGHTDTERDSAALQSDFRFGGGHMVTLGADYQDDRVDSGTNYVVTSRDNKGLFLQYLGHLGSGDIQISLREDDNEQFGTHGTGGVALGYEPSPWIRFTASYGTAFRAPNFNELYYPPDPVWGGGGNPDLRPETARSVELGMVMREDETGARWALNLYQTTIDDLIAWDAAANGNINIDKARIRGVEAQLGGDIGGWSVTASLSLNEPVSRTAATMGNMLPRRASRFLRFDLDRSYTRFGFGATLQAAGRRYDDLANSRRLDPYAIMELRASYRLRGAWLLQARVENLFDEEYETAAFYNQPGRGLYLTLRYTTP